MNRPTHEDYALACMLARDAAVGMVDCEDCLRAAMSRAGVVGAEHTVVDGVREALRAICDRLSMAGSTNGMKAN